MKDTLKSFGIGTINFFGIAIPGIILMLLSIIGFFTPLFLLLGMISKTDFTVLRDQISEYKFFIAVIFFILAYVLGFILRLKSPDELDEISFNAILKKKKRKKEKGIEDDWPFFKSKEDKFPYFNFDEYLEKRKLNDLKEYVSWGKDKDDSSSQKVLPRSKAHINIMKLEIYEFCPELGLIIDSNEAHIRLMSGTWSSVSYTRLLVIVGAIISITRYCLSFLNIELVIAGRDLFFANETAGVFLICAFISISLYVVMNWIKKKIELFFHYRRVYELLFVIIAYDLCKKKRSVKSAE